VVYNPGAMFTDPNAEILKQLTRIADALGKPGPSPWVEWVRTLSSFVAGVFLTMLSIRLQAMSHDTSEHKRMRRIIYRELAGATLELFGIVRGFSGKKTEVKPEDIKKGYKDPPLLRIVNPPWTFEGEDYMRQNKSVAYELPEMVFLKRMYFELHTFAAGTKHPIGAFKSVLRKISKEFETNSIVRKGFKRFAGGDYKSMEEIAKYFKDYKIPIEDFVRQVFKEGPADDQSQESWGDRKPPG
jgi:hypothetical protein